jgi:hypothetical protein
MVGVLIDLWETSICFRRADGRSVRHFNAIAVDRIDGNRERMTMVRLRRFGGLCDVINALWLNVWRGKKHLDIEFLNSLRQELSPISLFLLQYTRHGDVDNDEYDGSLLSDRIVIYSTRRNNDTGAIWRERGGGRVEEEDGGGGREPPGGVVVE